MSALFMFGVIFIAVVAMIIAISKFNIHPFIVMVVIAIAMGLVCGFDAVKVINTVKSGFGNILANIGIVILCGTIIGTILEKTGAALTMANSILNVVGKERSVLTMGAMGYVTGIPVFCDSGFVVLSPISRALAAQSNKSLAVMATALSGGLYATHCLVPPTPGPIAMAGTLGADLGLTIIVGLILSVPGVAVAVLYASKISSKVEIPANSQ
ncbi:MAG TPA: GntP family permease, partial [Candidatus Caccocola faecipullorum]|nr:GntP family permease [Candidatus Caccocola faecipullorum]